MKPHSGSSGYRAEAMHHSGKRYSISLSSLLRIAAQSKRHLLTMTYMAMPVKIAVTWAKLGGQDHAF